MGMVLLYPAGHYASRIRIVPTLKLPAGWSFACALDGASTAGDTTRFAETDLETLVDSPLFAGQHYRLVDLDPGRRAPGAAAICSPTGPTCSRRPTSSSRRTAISCSRRIGCSARSTTITTISCSR